MPGRFSQRPITITLPPHPLHLACGRAGTVFWPAALSRAGSVPAVPGRLLPVEVEAPSARAGFCCRSLAIWPAASFPRRGSKRAVPRHFPPSGSRRCACRYGNSRPSWVRVYRPVWPPALRRALSRVYLKYTHTHTPKLRGNTHTQYGVSWPG